MKRDILVSIIVPIYNQQEFLAKSLKSILNQTYSNIEIITVNDGSTDKSLNILEKFKCNDNRIKIINQENEGLVGATISGIENSTGEYICFVDPDDYIGENFIMNFINNLDDDYDFIAAGYYQDNGNWKQAKRLNNNKVYNNNEIFKKRDEFLCRNNELQVSYEFFISRWNKIYKRNTVNKIIDEFIECKKVSLGEDTLFNFLIISKSKKVKTLSFCNEYFYNVYNQNSMMKNSNINIYIQKCNVAFHTFVNILNKYNCNSSQAYLLFYFLIDSLYKRLYDNNSKLFSYLYDELRNNDIYMKTLDIILIRDLSIRKKIDIYIRKFIKKGDSYIISIKYGYIIKTIIKNRIDDLNYIKNNIINKKLSVLLGNLKFRNQRRKAFKDISNKLPIIESRISPFLEKYKNMKTDLNNCPIEKNIFIFWWDGFEKAPQIVKVCLESIKYNYYDYNIIEISKKNYKDYTDINLEIISAFEKEKISIQTFSDILRFNLLKNNGGMWIDATIFFEKRCDLFKKLENQSFNSLYFDSSKYFLNYKDEKCSWSGFFIASRKNGVLVEAINDIFEKYFIKYKEYTTYFFIDAVFIICKINKIDDDVLNKCLYEKGDMFLLLNLLNKPFDKIEFDSISNIPQKLTWFFKSNNVNDSYYEKIIRIIDRDFK